MKSAMQELKNNSLFTEGEEYIQIVLKKTEWFDLLEKEKEQIIDAYNHNMTGFDKLEQEEIGLNWAQDYYNQTYNQNES
jgi:hypothetical protein